MAKGETYVQWGGNYADYLTLHPYTVWDSVDHGRGISGDPLGIAPGEDIGIRDYSAPAIPYLPTVSVGQGGSAVGNAVIATHAAGAVVSAVAGPATGAPESYPEWAQATAEDGEPQVVSAYPTMAEGREEEDWDAIYAEYEVLNDGTNNEYRGVIPGDPWEDPGARNMAWTDWVVGAIDILDDGTYGNLGQPSSFVPPSGTPGTVSTTGTRGPIAPQSNLRWDARTGRWVCKRRRRRRLLTESDFNDLMRIATLPNKQNVTVALSKAIGRR